MKYFFQTGRPILKITAAVLLVLAAASLVGAATYAWHILSVAPEAGGMQITIGAAKVIQVAPDVVTGDKHEPGIFGDTLDITKNANYDYLNKLAGLTPVSTADGVHWYLPQYGDADAADGTEGPTAFTEDKELAHANLPAKQAAAAQEGSYYYMDFWVSAPEDFDLRLAAGDSQSAGSYALTLPLPERSETGWTLDYTAGLAAQKCLRLGFQTGFDGKESSFLIYEPNGTDDGTYTVTTPQTAAGETGDISDRLTVQQTSQWKRESLNNAFAQFVNDADADLLNQDALAVARQFYTEKLNGLYRPYVTSGQFYQHAADLYDGDAASAPASGAAADGVILRLKANEPQRIRLFVWLEGQDADCTNDAQNALLGIHLELAGSDQ